MPLNRRDPEPTMSYKRHDYDSKANHGGLTIKNLICLQLGPVDCDHLLQTIPKYRYSLCTRSYWRKTMFITGAENNSVV